MDPAVVAERALDGVTEGRFLIATHPHVRAYSDQRADEVAASFDPLGTGEGESYDVSTIVAAIMTENP